MDLQTFRLEGTILLGLNTVSVSRRLQVCEYDLFWGLKSIHTTYFGLFGVLGFLSVSFVVSKRSNVQPGPVRDVRQTSGSDSWHHWTSVDPHFDRNSEHRRSLKPAKP